MIPPQHGYLANNQWHWVNDLVPDSICHGVGVCTTFLLYSQNPKPDLKPHYARLVRDSQFFGYPMPWDDFLVFEACIDILLTDQLLPSTVYRVSIHPYQERSVVWVATRPYQPLPVQVKLQSVCFDRPFAQHKHLNYLQEHVYVNQAKKQGFTDILRLNTQGHVAESAFANLFIQMPDGQWLTPDPQQVGCLPGLTLERLKYDLAQAGRSLKHAVFDLDTVKRAQQVYLCNAVYGPYPVHQIDATLFNPLPFSLHL